MRFLLPLFFMACYAGMLLLLSRNVGVGVGLAIYVLLVGLFTCCGGWLLKESVVERVSWRNRVAGFCLPWTAWVGGGTMRSLLIKNAIAGIIFGFAVLAAEHTSWFQFQNGVLTDGTAAPASLQEWGLYLATWTCWLILSGLWLWMLKTFLTRSSDVLSVLTRQRGIWLPILVPPVAMAASITLRATGFPWLALLVAAAPLLYILLPVMLIIAVMLWHAVSGKPMRWN